MALSSTPVERSEKPLVVSCRPNGKPFMAKRQTFLAKHSFIGGYERCGPLSRVIRLDGFAVALPVNLDEIEEVRAGVFRRDALSLYPIKILPGEEGHVPFTS